MASPRLVTSLILSVVLTVLVDLIIRIIQNRPTPETSIRSDSLE